jgi:outer membrane protein TolC
VLFFKNLTLLLVTIPLVATTLPQLIERGLAENSAIKKTELQIDLMRTKQEESIAKQFGNLDLVGSYTHYSTPRTLAPIVPSSLSPTSSVDTTSNLFSSALQFSMPLFTGGALKEQVYIDKISERMGESRRALTKEELIYNIRSLYLSALSLQEIILSQEQYVVALESLSETISFGVEVGKKAKIELLKADNNLQEARGKVVVSQSSLRLVKETLEALTHHNNIGHLEPLEVSISSLDGSIKPADLEQLERFKLQDFEIEKGSKLIHKVEALQKPQVALSSYVGHNYDFDQIDPIENEYLWQVMVNIKWNLFDFGVNEAKVQQAKIAKLQSVVAKETTTEGFKKLFAKAKNEIETALSNHETISSQYALLQESQMIEEARYDAGVATLNDLLLAKSKTQLSKAQMIQSRYAYQNGVFYLEYLLERGVNSISSNKNLSYGER